MFSPELKKILELAKRTGDKVVIFDSNKPEDSYVVSTIDTYLEKEDSKEKKTENKENKKNKEEEKKNKSSDNEEEEKSAENTEENEKEESLTEEDLTDRINQEISMWKNQNKTQDLSEEDEVKKSWKIPPAVKNKAHNIE